MSGKQHGRPRPNRQAEVEKEYEQPFWDVVKQYADDGESKLSTAAILGYESAAAFTALIARHNKGDWFLPPQQTNGMRAMRQAKVGKDTEVLRKARTKAAEVNPRYYRFEYEGVTDTVAGHTRRLGLSYASIQHIRRACGDLSAETYAQALSKALAAKKRRVSV